MPVAFRSNGATMVVADYSESAQESYLREARLISEFFGKTFDDITVDDLQEYLAHRVWVASSTEPVVILRHRRVCLVGTGDLHYSTTHFVLLPDTSLAPFRSLPPLGGKDLKGARDVSGFYLGVLVLVQNHLLHRDKLGGGRVPRSS